MSYFARPESTDKLTNLIILNYDLYLAMLPYSFMLQISCVIIWLTAIESFLFPLYCYGIKLLLYGAKAGSSMHGLKNVQTSSSVWKEVKSTTFVGRQLQNS